MLLKSIQLTNIRSYESQRIDFPTGSTLLAGDIGSGKSTILLAIEFALFGVKRKHLSGSSLLRHGKKEGEVELNFIIDDKEIIIKRKLKRGKEDISQEAGYIITNGLKKEGTHIELKSIILNLLGYPQDLLSKSRDLIYRYTVYTPQEQMKQIVLEEKDIRLDTLRKVFNIDKYKRIRENSQIFVRNLKEKRKTFEGNIQDLEQKKAAKKQKQDEVDELNKRSKDISPLLEKTKQELEVKKQSISSAETSIKLLNELKKELQINELSLNNKLEKRKNNTEDIENLEKDTEKLKDDIKEKSIEDPEKLAKEIKDNETQLRDLSSTILEINKKISEFETKKRFSKETEEKVSKIDKCPMCLQNVTQDHKKAIHEKEHNIIEDMDKNIKLQKEQETEAKKKIENINRLQEEIRKKQFEVKSILLKTGIIKEKEKKAQEIKAQQEKLKQEIGQINMKKIELNKKIGAIKGIEEEYLKIRKELDIIQKKERELEIIKNSLEVKKEEITKTIKAIEEEINKKIEIKNKLTKLSQYQNWLEEHFINLMNTIEKHVMLQVYREFNELFQQWFNVLIEDETLSVRLDDEFTPVIDQNGYETEIENLSGGERTAVALAYRLALNRVINDIISEIKTKDILMLDEPTDGFSTEQLDKIRIILEELNIKQVIIVSHESKIESFVDNVIRINKNEQISQLA
ncbi:MAG: AAA family ATPase [Nanoarchaeota archaeon]|nr:AAA family ATPase [Nanoarchaeota archaeon]